MDRRSLVSGVAGLALGVFFFASPAGAEEVEHHGMQVNADATFSQCVSCHDGTVAHNVSFCTSKCDAATSHAVLKAYPPLRRASEFAPLAAVRAKGIKFDNGRVTCISCHNLRNPAKNHLVMENSGSRLCLTCHIRK